jgi:hypothetical protein
MFAETDTAWLAGEWQGTNRLWLSPDEPVRESPTTASIVPVAGERFATIRYTWADEGKPQDGLIVVRLVEGPEDVQMVWVDSWHMSRQFMLCRGATTRSGGVISATGSYAAPPGPDWGWRIEIHRAAPDVLRIMMYNILPDGQEVVAVEAEYGRSS